MPVRVTATLRKAVRDLEAEKTRIEHQLSAIRELLGNLGGGRGRAARRASGIRTRRRRLSPSARRAHSRRMKAYWAKRRAAAGAKTKRGPTTK
jgi:hypothetical protein